MLIDVLAGFGLFVLWLVSCVLVIELVILMVKLINASFEGSLLILVFCILFAVGLGSLLIDITKQYFKVAIVKVELNPLSVEFEKKQFTEDKR